MKITPLRFDAIINRYNQLQDEVYQFVKSRNTARWCESRISDSGDIEVNVNTSCHCHPEYEWRQEATKEEFLEWLSKRGQ